MKTYIKKFLFSIFLIGGICWVTVDMASAQRDGLGVGIVVGDPTGLSLKKFLSGNGALQAGMTWSRSGTNLGIPISGSSTSFFYLQLDYIYHVYLTSGRTGLQIPFYIGLGGFNIFRESPIGGLRLPLGLALHLGSLPLDIFFEVTP